LAVQKGSGKWRVKQEQGAGSRKKKKIIPPGASSQKIGRELEAFDRVRNVQREPERSEGSSLRDELGTVRSQIPKFLNPSIPQFILIQHNYTTK